jgi:hypothetical protein
VSQIQGGDGNREEGGGRAEGVVVEPRGCRRWRMVVVARGGGGAAVAPSGGLAPTVATAPYIKLLFVAAGGSAGKEF